MVTKLYPGGKARAFNVSYDDGVLQDIRFVELLNRYGLKGTFNLNYGLMRAGFEWTHECGMTIKRLPEGKIKALYAGHEIASHTYSHTYLDNATETEILREMGADKFFLERLLGTEVPGYATPFYFYSDQMADCVRVCGFEYARISEESNDYSVPSDFYRWRGSKFHWDENLEDFVQGFLASRQELALCQIVGHSYDLDVYDMWDRMERILKAVSRAPDVAPMTHIELVRYLRAMDQAEITDTYIQNNAHLPLWFRAGGETIRIKPGQRKDVSI